MKRKTTTIFEYIHSLLSRWSQIFLPNVNSLNKKDLLTHISTLDSQDGLSNPIEIQETKSYFLCTAWIHFLGWKCDRKKRKKKVLALPKKQQSLTNVKLRNYIFKKKYFEACQYLRTNILAHVFLEIF